MPQQENTSSVFHWVWVIITFCVAFAVLKVVFAVALHLLFYGVVGLVAASVAVHLVKKLKS